MQARSECWLPKALPTSLPLSDLQGKNPKGSPSDPHEARPETALWEVSLRLGKLDVHLGLCLPSGETGDLGVGEGSTAQAWGSDSTVGL